MKDCRRVPKYDCARLHGGGCGAVGCPDFREDDNLTSVEPDTTGIQQARSNSGAANLDVRRTKPNTREV